MVVTRGVAQHRRSRAGSAPVVMASRTRRVVAGLIDSVLIAGTSAGIAALLSAAIDGGSRWWLAFFVAEWAVVVVPMARTGRPPGARAVGHDGRRAVSSRCPRMVDERDQVDHRALTDVRCRTRRSRRACELVAARPLDRPDGRPHGHLRRCVRPSLGTRAPRPCRADDRGPRAPALTADGSPGRRSCRLPPQRSRLPQERLLRGNIRLGSRRSRPRPTGTTTARSTAANPLDTG